MATQTLTYAPTTTSTSSYTKLTIPNASVLPRTKSVESIKLVGRNPSPPPSTSSKLQRSSSASEMLALVNLANLQRLHIRASEPSPSSGGLDSSLASQDEDNDEENAASGSGSSSSSDSEECETPDQVSPPYSRPTSPIGYIYDYDSEDEESWDIRKVKYTAGAELAPCFARGTAPESATAPAAAAAPSSSSSLRSSFSDSEDDEDEEDDGMMMNDKKRSWSPGTPAIEKVEYHWSTTTNPASSSASSSTVATPLTTTEEEEEGYFNDNGEDDDDMIGSELDADEVWPDEMDSDDFPFLHSWPHSWIWTPPTDSPSTYSNPTPNPLPMIHFHFVESQVPDQSSWTPIQDSRFGGLLTVPGHRAYNSVETTKARLPRSASSAVVAPMQQLCEGAKVEYDEKLGRCAVKVPGLKEQREMGLYSIPSLSSSSSSSSKKGRGRARSRVRGMEDDEVDEADFRMEDGRGRGRTSARKSATQSARHFVLSAIREADDGDEEYEEEPFVYDGVHGRALSRWD